MRVAVACAISLTNLGCHQAIAIVLLGDQTVGPIYRSNIAVSEVWRLEHALRRHEGRQVEW